MNPLKSPLIVRGQLYLNEDVDEYLIVTNNHRGMISYVGNGFSGRFDDWSFIDRFQPVDPEDVDDEEIEFLLKYCPEGTEAKIGYIYDTCDISDED